MSQEKREKEKEKSSSLFIVFEGPEGAGKTTQIAHLAARLKEHGVNPVLTREPGGTPAADAVRSVILDPALTIDPLAEFLLYSASRAQHVAEVIAPALEKGKTIISDRFFGASVAYQGYGRGLELAFIHTLTERVTLGTEPDLVILLDIDPAAGLERVAQRGQRDRLELADLAFHRRVREGFLKQAEENDTWTIFDATQSEMELADALWETVRERLKL